MKAWTVTDRESLESLIRCINNADVVAFDLETSGFDEFEQGAMIISLGLTLKMNEESGGGYQMFGIPLAHPMSPLINTWQRVLRAIAKCMRKVPIRVGHNAKFDCRWLAHFGAPVPCNFDTMLAAHLLDENRRKGLKPLAETLLGVEPWDIGINGRSALPWYLQHRLRDILKYNVLDTRYTMMLYDRFSEELDEQPRLAKLLSKLLMPASQSLVHIERRGVFVSRERLDAADELVTATLDRIHGELHTHVPDDPPYPINWNRSKFLMWFLYEHLELPVYARSEKTGDPSCAEATMMRLAAEGHPVPALLVERVSWQKANTAFITPYKELIDGDRIRTTFKLAGTVTGRLSSGKADGDKVSGSRSSNLRGCNLQQVPRDPLIRGIFGAAPGWTFIEADYSQIELRIAAEVAQERTMLGLYSAGQDIHMAMAMRMTGKPAAHVTKEERKKAKAVNFGFLYGMGWKKFIETAWSNYGVVVTEEEAKAFRRAFFQQFPDLIHWHARQRRLVRKYARVQSPLGRVRHLPDINHDWESKRAEAERQSINSPVQAMASDMCLLSLVLLDREFKREGLRATPIGTVHDAINFECPDEELTIVIPMIKHRMENPPTRKLFGYQLKVPVVADVAIGQFWGDKQEIPGDIVDNPTRLGRWLDEH